jgi:hypothetical protein
MHSWPFHLLTYRKRKENMGKQMSTGNWSWQRALPCAARLGETLKQVWRLSKVGRLSATTNRAALSCGSPATLIYNIMVLFGTDFLGASTSLFFL